MGEVNFDVLLHLLKASSKSQVVDFCHNCYIHKDDISSHHKLVENTSVTLNIGQEAALETMNAMAELEKKAVFHNCSSIKDVAALFPENFHKNLKELLSKIITENIHQWKTDTINSLVSLPKLVDFDWQVNVKMASNNTAKINIPACVLNLKKPMVVEHTNYWESNNEGIHEKACDY
ncbi:COMM domain-containing protein 9-like isoform X2 [Limulus polyphemus]|uniref:COMM domain-containing protein 9-like isoform X2 n=1 Tax=Limulus polyphemus TaxID=6850 RepID=A0ABM1TII4_LIMPO|nr:COMM domain-containing protein 9-like isoform X2 [Limulus polyphemus]